jgi:hypothetical protein
MMAVLPEDDPRMQKGNGDGGSPPEDERTAAGEPQGTRG